MLQIFINFQWTGFELLNSKLSATCQYTGIRLIDDGATAFILKIVDWWRKSIDRESWLTKKVDGNWLMNKVDLNRMDVSMHWRTLLLRLKKTLEWRTKKSSFAYANGSEKKMVL